jgi:protein-L-isoaspartate O-methyltransferase
VFRKFFQRASGESDRAGGPRIPRHSSGWAAMLKFLQQNPNLRVLDIGATSSQNINFLTGLGHSVYMGDIVRESLSGVWELPPIEEGQPPRFNAPGFFEQNLNFGGREFDVVLLWTALDYIPQGLVEPLIEHLKNAVRKGGLVLAIFHRKATGPNTAFCRYHVTGGDTIEMQDSGPHPIQRVYTNRRIEELFSGFSGNRFFLAQDNLYEVLITR